MVFLWYTIIAIVSGVFAGMGMGGGTFLIPLLTLFLSVPQTVAQCLNLVVFVPMAILNIIIYSKHKLIDFKNWWLVSVPACMVSLTGALVAYKISDKALKIIFGAFICIIGIVQVISLVIKHMRRRSKNV